MKKPVRWREQWELELEIASRRVGAITMVDPGFEAPFSWTVGRYRAVFADAMSAESYYRAACAQVEEARRRCQAKLEQLAEGSERILQGVVLKYSCRSPEYALVRGTPRPRHRDDDKNGPSSNPPQ